MKKLIISLILVLSIGLTSCEPETNDFSVNYFNKEYRDNSNNLYQIDRYSLKSNKGNMINIVKECKLENYNNTDRIIYNGNVFETTIKGDTIIYKISIYHVDSNQNIIFENIDIKTIKQNNQIIDIIE